MKNEQIKALIEISRNTDEANVVIERYLSLKTVEEKIAYLQANFDVEIIHATDDNKEVDYICMLDAIINAKYK